MLSRSQNIKKAMTRHMSYSRVDKHNLTEYFKVDDKNVIIGRVPLCCCSNYSIENLCEHVFYVYLFHYKVHITNYIMKLSELTSDDIGLLFLKKLDFNNRRINRRRRLNNNNENNENIENNDNNENNENNDIINQPNEARRRREREVRRRLMISIRSHTNRLNNIRHIRANERRHLEIRATTYSNISSRYRNVNRRMFNRSYNYNRIQSYRIRGMTTNFILANIEEGLNNICSICQSIETNNINIINVKCNICTNIFHNDCIDKWICIRMRDRHLPSCPLCRTIIDVNNTI